jgi:high-affinity K+ transport system ATPase subunit B
MLSWLVVFLAISAAYLYAFPQPNIFYAVIVALHAAGGVLATLLIIATLFRLLRNGSIAARAGWSLIAAGALLGIVLIKTGTPRSEWNKLYFHIVLSLAGLGLLGADWWGRARR